jgi:monoamine oxidase
MANEADVAVVGAGLAGLVAARELQSAGLNAVVFEARDRVGGRVWTVPAHDGAFIDHGGQFVGPTQDRILSLAADLGVRTFPCFGDGDRHISVHGRDDVDLAAVADVIDTLERMAKEITPEAPWAAEHASEWDAQTFQTWLLAQIPDPTLRAVLRVITRAVFTAEADELSLLHVLAYIRSAGSMMALTQMQGGAQEQRFAGGAQSVARRLADALGSNTVRLSSPVRRIRQSDDAVFVEADGAGTVRARRAIVAVPIPLAERILYTPALPGHRSQLHQRMSPGATIKVHCVYPSPFWRAVGHSGRMFSDRGYVSATFDNCCPDATPGVLVGFIEADGARSFARLSPGQRRTTVLDELVHVFGPQAANPLDYVEQNWLDDEWTRGCYGANFGPGGWTRYGAALREPFGLVHWAGAETATIWMNYMDGAVRSGERAAAEIVAALG